METFIGDIQLFPYNFAPKYWAKCDGSVIQISENTSLFALIGIKFGGDGRTTFRLPNLQGAEPIQGVEYYISLNGIYPSRT